MAHLQYIHPLSLAGGVGQLTGDGGFGGGDTDDISGVHDGGLRLWETKYQFQKDMLPMFVGEAFGRKVHFLQRLLLLQGSHHSRFFLQERV